MGGTCATDASNSEIAKAVLTIPQTISTNNLTGTITYNYHSHTTNCSTVSKCGGHIYLKEQTGSNGGTSRNPICSGCGHIYSGHELDLVGTSCARQVTKYSCGYTEGQLISATITY